MGVLQDQAEGVDCGLHEVVTSQSNLDVGVLAHILHALLKASQEEAHAPEDSLREGVLASGTLKLFAEVFEANANELADCDDQGTKSD